MLLLLVAGCSSRPALPPMPRYAAGQACYAELAPRGALWAAAASPRSRGSCAIADPVRIDATSSMLWVRPPVIACPLANALARFSQEVVQPAAMKEFGRPIVRLHHLGAWDCRKRTGSFTRMSEHATGRAIDLAAFELADGTRISVKNDWGDGRKGRFLRDVATRACAYFSVVLTPETDRYHQDHFHLDVGPYRACD